MNSESPPLLYSDHGLDFGVAWNVIWARRLPIALATTAFTTCVCALAWTVAKYRSEGVLQIIMPITKVSEISPALSVGLPIFTDYKRIAPVIYERRRLEQFIAYRKLDGDMDAASLLDIFQSAERVARHVEPIYGISRADTKLIGETNNMKEAIGQLIGISLSAESFDAEAAPRRAQLLGDYVRDAVFSIALLDLLSARESDARQLLLTLQLSLLNNRFTTKQLNEKIGQYKNIGSRYAEGARTPIGSPISLSESTIRFLPLPTQIVAAEASIVDATQSRERMQREFAQAEVAHAYYVALRNFFSKAPTAESLIEFMPEARKIALRGKDAGDETIRQVALQLELEYQQVRDALFNRSRFTSGPTLPRAKIAVKQVGILALAAATTFALLAIGFVLLRDTKLSRSSVAGRESANH
jgi:hypothetical protein